MQFNYDKIIRKIKIILGDLYKYHSFNMEMFKENEIDNVSFFINTSAEDIYEIPQDKIDKLEYLIGQLDYSVDIALAPDPDFEKIFKNFDIKDIANARPMEEIIDLDYEKLNPVEKKLLNMKDTLLIIANYEIEEEDF